MQLLCFITARVTSRFLLFRRRSGSTHSARPTHKFSFRLLFRSSQLYHLLAELFYLHVAISLSSSADSRYFYVVISLSRSILSLSLASRRCVWDPRTCASIAVVSLSLSLSSQVHHLLARSFCLHVVLSLSTFVASRYFYVVISLSDSFLSLSLSLSRLDVLRKTRVLRLQCFAPL